MTDNFDKLFKRFAKLGPRQFENWAIIGSCSIGHYKRVKKIKTDKTKELAKWISLRILGDENKRKETYELLERGITYVPKDNKWKDATEPKMMTALFAFLIWHLFEIPSMSKDIKNEVEQYLKQVDKTSYLKGLKGAEIVNIGKSKLYILYFDRTDNSVIIVAEKENILLDFALEFGGVIGCFAKGEHLNGHLHYGFCPPCDRTMFLELTKKIIKNFKPIKKKKATQRI